MLWEESQRDEAKIGLVSILSSANSRLDIACPEHIRASDKIRAKINEINKPWMLKVKATTNSIANIQTVNEAASEISRYLKKINTARIRIPDSKLRNLFSKQLVLQIMA